MERLLRRMIVTACMLAVLTVPVLSESTLQVPAVQEEACSICTGETAGACPECERQAAATPVLRICCGHLATGHSPDRPDCDESAPHHCPGPCPCCSTTLPTIVLMLVLPAVGPVGVMLTTPVCTPAALLLSRVDEPQSPVPRV